MQELIGIWKQDEPREVTDWKYPFDTVAGTRACIRQKTIISQFYESACSGRTNHISKN